MFTRRQFLAGLSFGAATPLFMPLMRSLLAEEGSAIPRRFVWVVEGNGIEPVNFLSDKTRTALDAKNSTPIGTSRLLADFYQFDTPQVIPNANLSSALALSSLAQGGLDKKSAVIFGLSNIISGGGHSTFYGALGCMRSAGSPAGETIDSALANLPTVRGTERDRGVSPFSTFRGGVHEDANVQSRTGMCAYAPGRPAPVFVNPSAAYFQLFASADGGEAGRLFGVRERQITYAKRDTQRLMKTFASSSPEYEKLQRYFHALEDLTRRQATLTQPKWKSRINVDGLGRVHPEVPQGASWTAQPFFNTNSPLERLGLHFDMATAAMLGGLTNTVVLGSGFGGGYNIDYTTLGLNGNQSNRHTLCHSAYQSAGGFTTENRFSQYLSTITSRHVEGIAKMAATLDAIPEGEGTMLDHTVIVYMSDNGDVHHSGAKDWPMLIVGGSKLGFQTDGRTVVYPGHGREGNRQVSNLFNTLGYAAGGQSIVLERDKKKLKFDWFGQETDERRNAPGPLSELWQP